MRITRSRGQQNLVSANEPPTSGLLNPEETCPWRHPNHVEISHCWGSGRIDVFNISRPSFFVYRLSGRKVGIRKLNGLASISAATFPIRRFYVQVTPPSISPPQTILSELG